MPKGYLDSFIICLWKNRQTVMRSGSALGISRVDYFSWTTRLRVTQGHGKEFIVGVFFQINLLFLEECLSIFYSANHLVPYQRVAQKIDFLFWKASHFIFSHKTNKAVLKNINSNHWKATFIGNLKPAILCFWKFCEDCNFGLVVRVRF